MINNDGDRPRGYEYPRPSIKGGSVGPNPTGPAQQLTRANLEKVRKAVIRVSDSLTTASLIPKP
jgi:hypothetical protein